MKDVEANSQKPIVKKGFKLKAEMIIALSAVFISVATLSVYIYQASIMQSQQHASVWPYLESTYLIRSGEGFVFTVTNKGVGPAIIKSNKMMYGNVEVKDAREFITKFIGLDTVGFFYSSVNKRVLAAGEGVEVFHVYVKDNLEYQQLQVALDNLYEKLTFEICYCSIYGDCWLMRGKGQEIIPCD